MQISSQIIFFFFSFQICHTCQFCPLQQISKFWNFNVCVEKFLLKCPSFTDTCFFFSNHPIVLGENYGNFYRVLGIFAAAFKSDVLSDDDEMKQRMIVILKQAQVSVIISLSY